ncbi:MAG: tetratricopeptide repeat protein [Anaerolineales bacterium]|nr:tetratricopeptide repeat protein [Anaerolineales bacterium]
MTNISNTLNSDDNFEILYQLIDDGDFAQAIKLATQCTQIEPDNPEVWIMLATTQRELELFEEATHSIRKAIALSPDTAKYYCALGLTLEHLARLIRPFLNIKQAFD